MSKAHIQGRLSELGKFFGRDLAEHPQLLARKAQVLTQSQDLHADGSQLA
jgi:hypothetical protein